MREHCSPELERCRSRRFSYFRKLQRQGVMRPLNNLKIKMRVLKSRHHLTGSRCTSANPHLTDLGKTGWNIYYTASLFSEGMSASLHNLHVRF